MTEREIILRDCRNNAIHCLGTSHILNKKAHWYKKLIRLTTVLGLITPLLIGGIALAYGANSAILILCIKIVSPVLIIQLILSGISLVYKWEDILTYSIESQNENKILADNYISLANKTNLVDEILDQEYQLIKVKDQSRTNQDSKVDFSEKEKRFGMRYALYIYGRECAICKEVPKTMKSTDCNTCGNF